MVGTSRRSLEIETLAALVCYDDAERFIFSRARRLHIDFLWKLLSQRGWKMTSKGIAHPEHTHGLTMDDVQE